jgi:SH3-like domain-containing protein
MRLRTKRAALCAGITLLACLGLAATAASQDFAPSFGPRQVAAATRQSLVESADLGRDSGLPVPRFVSLKDETANARRGPSTSQPILWVYQRRDLPLQVTGESGPWRRVRDPDGTEVWMHKQNLDPRRTVYVRPQNAADAPLRAEPREGARPVAYLAEGVVGRLTGCEGEWRRVTVGGRVGWIEASALWAAGDCSWT